MSIEELKLFEEAIYEKAPGQIPEKSALPSVKGVPGANVQEMSTTDLLPREIETPEPSYVAPTEVVKTVVNNFSHPILRYMRG